MARTTLFAMGLFVAFVVTGCMSPYYGQYDREEERIADSLLPPPLTIDDVIALAQDTVSDAIIISQIKATRSYFQLTTEDIRKMKKAGVSEKVITAMINTAEPPRYARRQRRYYSSPGYYYPYYYGYPWYSSIYFGFGYRPSYFGHGYYGGHYFGGHGYGGHYSGGHGGGGHRSIGGHR